MRFYIYIVVILISLLCCNTVNSNNYEFEIFEKQLLKDYSTVYRSKSNNKIKKFAIKYFNVYMNKKPSKIANKALDFAFVAARNSKGVSQKITTILRATPSNNVIWNRYASHIADSTLNAFYNDNDLNNGIDLLYEIQTKMQSKINRSEILYSIAFALFSIEKYIPAKRFFNEIIQLKANKGLVSDSKDRIYEIEHLNIGNNVPVFNTKDIKGDIIRSNNFKGKYIFIHFWSVYCGISKRQMPFIEKAYKIIKDRKDVIFIGVKVLPKRGIPKDKKIVNQKKYSWTQIEEVNGEGLLVNKFKINGLPNSYLIDKRGKIIDKDLRNEELINKLNKLLRN